MSTSDAATPPSNTRTFRLTLASDTRVKVTILDAQGSSIASGEAPISFDLPRGIYRVRAHDGSLVREQSVRLSGDLDVRVEGPQYLTASPIESASNSGKDHEAAARHWSCHPTCGTATPRLMVFLRAAQGTSLDTSVGLQDWKDKSTRPIGGASVSQRGAGWLAFSEAVEPGTHCIVDARDGGRVMPVLVAEQFCSAVFVRVDDVPRLDNARVFMTPRGSSFEPNGELERTVDRGLAALQEGREPSDVDFRRFLGGKLDNPMLGLLAGHLLTARDEPESLLAMIVGNLRNLLGDAPDVHALALSAAQRWGQPWQGPRFSSPPMFRAGFLAVQKWAAEHEDLVDEPLLDVADSLLFDSPWTQWELEDALAFDESRGVLERVVKGIGTRLTELDLVVLQRVGLGPDGESRVRRSASSDPHLIARDLGLSPKAIERSLSRLRDIATRSGRQMHELLEHLVKTRRSE